MVVRVETPYTQRARYYSSADAFNIKRPEIPAHLFRAERDRAFAADAPSGLIPLDLSAELEIPFPATTPLILARYGRIRAGARLAPRFEASGEMYYVMRGAGESHLGDDVIGWEAGDAFCLPGGSSAVHTARQDSLLWIVTNEPQLAYEGARVPAPGRAPIEIVHYPGDEIRRRLERIHSLPTEKTMVGKAINLSSRRLDHYRTCLPSFTLSMNSLSRGDSQRPHRHNAVAVTLVVQGSRCYSTIDGRRVDWEPDTVMITPPGAMHSHHNDGDELALFLIVQDGGLYYHCRTMGFAY